MKVLLSSVLSLAALLLARAVYRRLTRGRLEAGAIAVITGGGSGVGLELARIFAAARCRVVLVGRNEASLKEAVAICKAAGAASADYIIADLCAADGASSAAAAVKCLHATRLESVKYLVLNAGAGAIAPFACDARFEQITRDMMEINYFANVRLLQQLMPLLSANNARDGPRRPSRIIVLSSLAGVLPSIVRSAYTASKHAIQGFMNALRGETAVPITLCCPGYVDTDFHQRVLTADGKPLPGHQRRGVSPAVCAGACVQGALSGDAEVIMTLAGKLGYALRPLLTGIVDTQAKRMSLKSLEGKGGASSRKSQ